MRSSILTTLLIFSFLFSCTDAEITETKTTSSDTNTTQVPEQNQEKIENTIAKNDTLSIDTFYIGKKIFSLIKIELYLTEKDTLDPIMNVVYSLEKDTKIKLLTTGTIYEEDFSMYGNATNFVVFENYFSTTGNKEYFFLTKDEQLFRTEALDESFILDKNSLDINKLTVMGKDYDGNLKEIKLTSFLDHNKN